MKALLLPLGFVLFAVAAQAQSVDKIDFYEYGIYASSPRTAVGRSEQGMTRYQAEQIQLQQATRTVIARIGTEFGFRYRVTGRPTGAPVLLTIVTKFPQPGVLAPKGSVPFVQDVDHVITAINGRSFLTWPFERRSDLVPGIWTIEIWQGNRKLGEQSFNIILPPVS